MQPRCTPSYKHVFRSGFIHTCIFRFVFLTKNIFDPAATGKRELQFGIHTASASYHRSNFASVILFSKCASLFHRYLATVITWFAWSHAIAKLANIWQTRWIAWKKIVQKRRKKKVILDIQDNGKGCPPRLRSNRAWVAEQELSVSIRKESRQMNRWVDKPWI